MKTLYLMISILFLLYAKSMLPFTALQQQAGLKSVVLLNVNAAVEDNRVHFTWESANYDPNIIFFLERSSDGLFFTEIDTIYSNASGSVFSSQDIHPLQGISYYRIKTMDQNANVFFSEMFDVEFYPKEIAKSFEILQFFPIPFSDKGNIIIRCKTEMLIDAKIIDMNGKSLKEYHFYCLKGNNMLDVIVEGDDQGSLFQIIVSDEYNNIQKFKIIKSTNN